jgi:hypothetical protein
MAKEVRADDLQFCHKAPSQFECGKINVADQFSRSML